MVLQVRVLESSISDGCISKNCCHSSDMQLICLVYAQRDGSSLQSAVPDECLTENEVPSKPSKTGMASLEKVGPVLQGWKRGTRKCDTKCSNW